jgi:hypothetical protein
MLQGADTAESPWGEDTMTELLDSMIELLTSVPIGSPERPAGAATTRRCLRCWSEDLRPVESAGGTNLFCTGCHRCRQRLRLAQPEQA